MRRIGVVALTTAYMWSCNVAMAMAQGSNAGERVGDNLGDLLGDWAKSLYVGIAAIVALMFLLNRRFADLAIFLVAAVVVGGFVLAPGEVSDVVKGIWDSLTA